MRRALLALTFCALAIVAINLMSVFLDEDLENFAIVLLDKGGVSYPYSVQNLMWIFFFLGLAEIINRFIDARKERAQLSMGYLPEDEETLLVKENLPSIFKKTALIKDADNLFLPNMIKRIITVFQTTNSVENASAVLSSSLELRSHDLDLKYSILRYIMWVIPTFGFIGTVIGIALALAYAGEPDRAQDPLLLTHLTRKLAVAFNTTMVALVMSAILVLVMNVVEAFEERILNRCGQYCLDNLVNRLYRPERSDD